MVFFFFISVKMLIGYIMGTGEGDGFSRSPRPPVIIILRYYNTRAVLPFGNTVLDVLFEIQSPHGIEISPRLIEKWPRGIEILPRRIGILQTYGFDERGSSPGRVGS